MVFSYSGIVNYGKTTLPSVESWGTNMNILRDPPKSIHTRKIDKVGETSAITSKIDESGDRFCEAINYYARGQNPMVSVSYGQGQQSGSQAFLPYRIMRDGAFRPPVWRQEDLLPLSRMPRVWTEVSTQPYKPIFTQRIKNCGIAEDTNEIQPIIWNKVNTQRYQPIYTKRLKNVGTAEDTNEIQDIIWNKVNTQRYQPIYTKRLKNVGTAEDTNEIQPIIWNKVNTQRYQPIYTKRLRDANTAEDTNEIQDIIWNKVNTQRYQPIYTKRLRNVGTAEETRQVKNNPLQVACAVNRTVMAYPNINQPDIKPGLIRDPLAFGQVESTKSCQANASEIVGRNTRGPLLLAPSRPITSGATNPVIIKETPIVLKNVKLNQKYPVTTATTNFSASGFSGYNGDKEYNRLPSRTNRGGFNGNQSIPSVNMVHPVKNMIKVR